MNQVINFEIAKKKYIPSIVHIGDLVEWEDFDGQAYEGIVLKINHIPLEGLGFNQDLDSFPLWEKEEYSVTFKDGLSVAGSAITDKVIRRGFKVKKSFGAHSYAN